MSAKLLDKIQHACVCGRIVIPHSGCITRKGKKIFLNIIIEETVKNKAKQ